MKNGEYELVIPSEDYPGKRYRGRYCYEHHYVWWLNTNEIIPNGYEIHHINGLKRDNRFENFEKLESQQHKVYHAKKRTYKCILNTWICKNCGVIFYRKKQGMKIYSFCSRKCIGLFGFNSKIRRNIDE
jgi:hypothetical protein